MANATSVTINSMTSESAIAQGTANVLDTGTAPVTLPVVCDGDSRRLLMEFTNTAQAADTMTVAILAGANPPALRAGAVGDASFTVAQSAVKYIVVDSSRHMQANGTISVKITPAGTKTQTATIRVYKLPK